MKNFVVVISAQVPFPKDFSYRPVASNIATAVARAIKDFRKELGRKRVKELRIYVTCASVEKSKQNYES